MKRPKVSRKTVGRLYQEVARREGILPLDNSFEDVLVTLLDDLESDDE